jgi:hypothetical protein
MTFTYDAEALNDVGRIRLEIGDTDSLRQLLQDEEIEQVITEQSSFKAQCAACCRLIVSIFAGKPQSISLGDGFKETSTEMYNRYLEMAKRYEAQGSAPWSSAIDVATKESYTADTSTMQPNFRLGMHRNVG